jgi:hypothetical protein
VDGEPVLEGAPSPWGPLGLVMWMDNQYMVATPWGHLGWGLLDVPGRQWMEVEEVMIRFLSSLLKSYRGQKPKVLKNRISRVP